MTQNMEILNKFINPETLTISSHIELNTEAITIILSELEMYLPLGSLIDISEEIKRLENELTKLTSEITRGENMLSNERFISKAPASKVELERSKLANYKEQFITIKARIKELNK